MKDRAYFLIITLVAFFVGGAVTYYFIDTKEAKQNIINVSKTDSTGIIKCSNEFKIDETGVSQAVGEIYNATVTIQNYQNDRLYGTGSGFVYKKDDKYGYIMTNHHVIEGANKLIITLANDDQVEGEVLGSDKYLDLAVVRIDAKSVLQVAKIGTSEKSNIGDTVITVGSPAGYNYRGTVTRGTLSGKNRLVEVSVAATNDFVMQVLQIDAAISPGNSGGPLVNINGEVIGINSLKLVRDEIEGMGFAIPIEYAMKYVEAFEKGEEIERPLIGITMVSVTDTYRLYQNGISISDDIKKGVVITNIVKNSGASKAGLKRGDIITKINGNEVSNIAYLKYELYKTQVGDTIYITYLRNGKEKTVDVTLTKIEE